MSFLFFHQFLPRSSPEPCWYVYWLHGSCMDGPCVLHNRTQLPGIERLMQAQRTSDDIQRLNMFRKETDGTIIGPLHNAIDFFVNDAGRAFTVLVWSSCRGCTSEWILALTKGDRAEPFAHTPTRDHLARNRSDTLQVVFCACRDVSNRHLLGSATAKGRHQ